jgi:transposase
MATIDYWAEAPTAREQIALFSPTLDDTISEDDPVRIVDEVLAGCDWSEWEAEYDGKRGQPPIHPRHVAAGILYGLYRGIRSTRKLEEACVYRLDFIWLMEGRKIDHTTFAKFRTRFDKELKGLFRQIGQVAMTLGLIRLGEVAFDGTRVKANNSRYRTRTAKKLQEQLDALDALFEQMMAEMDAGDREAKALFDDEESTTRLPEPLADIDKRRQHVAEALEKVEQADKARRASGQKTPAQLPTTDPDSRVMPNKEGGYAPNYTPTATTDGHCGFIIDADVTDEVNESHLALESVDRIEETFGERPEKFLTDGGNASGAIMQGMQERDVEFYAPAKSNEPQPGNPACREDPTEPVPESEWPNMPRNRQKRLDKSCFVYDSEADQYWCPQGHPMPFEKTKPDTRGGERITRRVYRCSHCKECPLAGECVSPSSKGSRTVTRDGYEEVRHQTATRMASEEAKTLYNRRSHIAETPFGILKSQMGLRQFLLRGLDKVKTEWSWACTGFNLKKLVRAMGVLRAQLTEMAAEPVS